MRDIRQTLQYAEFLKKEGWIVERIDKVNYFIRKFPLIGSVLKLQRPEKLDFKTLLLLAKKYRSFQVIIEPKIGTDSVPGFRLSKSTYLPSKTIQIDLTQSSGAIFANFKKDARYAIKRGEGISIKKYSTPDEIIKWRDAWKKSVNFKRFVPSTKQLINLCKSFPNNDSLFLASHNINGSIIGGALFTKPRESKIAYYWYAFTNSEGRTSLSQYSLLYHGILWAKKLGCKVFDFEGVYDPRFPNKSWLGFTHFKKSFRGHEVTYPGCYTKLGIPSI
jgi:lipid II:glycine glycyltransferase (peptidoglycan interpeptide bridge formation enzyme)